MDRGKAKEIRAFLNELFEKAEKKAERELKVRFSIGSISFGSDNASVKVSVSDVVVSGRGENKQVEVKTKEAMDFKRYAPMFDLEADDFGKTFNMRGKEYKIVGLKPRSKKYPVLAEADGKVYKVPVDMVNTYLKR